MPKGIVHSKLQICWKFTSGHPRYRWVCFITSLADQSMGPLQWMGISCLNSHSDGTHSLKRIHWWASDVMLNFSKSVLIKKSEVRKSFITKYVYTHKEFDRKKQSHLIYILDGLRVSTFLANFYFLVNYSFKTDTTLIHTSVLCYIQTSIKKHRHAPWHTLLLRQTERKNSQAQIKFHLYMPNMSTAKQSLVLHNTHFVTREAHKFQQPESPCWQ